MDKILLKEVIEDLQDALNHTAGESKYLISNAIVHLTTEYERLCEDKKEVL